VSINVRQNDALFEFENCMSLALICIPNPLSHQWHAVKKKFLLANKHITKWPTSFSIR
jgi:hypothetical protein